MSRSLPTLTVALTVLLVTPTSAAQQPPARPSTSAPPTKRECVAASESGQDLRGSGKLHDARTAFAVCTSASCPRPVREDCAQKLADIDATMPSLVLVAKDAQGNDLPDALASIDGESYSLDGNAIDVDPGPHRVFFRSGRQTQVREIVAQEGDKNRRIEVTFAPPAATAPSPPPSAPAPAREGDGDAQRWVGIGLGAGAAVALVGGSVLSLLAKSLYDRAYNAECDRDPNHCSQQGRTDGDTAHSLADASTAAFIGAGALVAAGAALYFTAPAGSHRVSASVAFGDGGAGLIVRGVW